MRREGQGIQRNPFVNSERRSKQTDYGDSCDGGSLCALSNSSNSSCGSSPARRRRLCPGHPAPAQARGAPSGSGQGRHGPRLDHGWDFRYFFFFKREREKREEKRVGGGKPPGDERAFLRAPSRALLAAATPVLLECPFASSLFFFPSYTHLSHSHTK